MPEAGQDEDDDRPEPPPRVEEPETGEDEEDGPSQQPVASPEDRVERVPAVELSRGDQVDGGDDETPPRREERGVLHDVDAREGVPRQEKLEQLHGERVAEVDRPLGGRV
ncbi:MAG: hypothetical protein KBB14_14590, partial [Thermoanaerobaculia bacterium]|nr:hypothetical protein [Thermoanaerobaculia bacterium]